MMTYAKLKLSLGIAVAALLAAGTVNVAVSSMTDDKNSAGVATSQEKKYANEVIKSVADDDYQEFIADGDKTFQTIKKTQFEAVAVQRSAQLKNGYHVIFLGVLTENNNRITLWKVSYDDGSDDDLLRLAVSKDKISGALLTPPFE